MAVSHALSGRGTRNTSRGSWFDQEKPGEAKPQGDISGDCGSSVTDLVNRTSLLETAEVYGGPAFTSVSTADLPTWPMRLKRPVSFYWDELAISANIRPSQVSMPAFTAEVRLLRNLTGLVAEIPLDEVVEATRYSVHVLDERDAQARTRAEVTAAPDCQCARGRQLPSDGNGIGLFSIAPGMSPIIQKPFIMAVMRSIISSRSAAQSGHSPSHGFDAAWYNSQRPDLVIVTDPVQHYLLHGRGEGLRPCPHAMSTVAQTHPTTEQMAATLASLANQPPSCDDESGEMKRSPVFLPFTCLNSTRSARIITDIGPASPSGTTSLKLDHCSRAIISRGFLANWDTTTFVPWM